MLEIFNGLPKELLENKEINNYTLSEDPTDVILTLVNNTIDLNEDELKIIFDKLLDVDSLSDNKRIYCIGKILSSLVIRKLPLIDAEYGASESMSEYCKKNYLIKYLISNLNFAHPFNKSLLSTIKVASNASYDMEVIKLFVASITSTLATSNIATQDLKTSLLNALFDYLFLNGRENEQLLSYKDHRDHPDYINFITTSRDYICVELANLFFCSGADIFKISEHESYKEAVSYALFIQNPEVKREHRQLFGYLVKFFRPDYKYEGTDVDSITGICTEDNEVMDKKRNEILPDVTRWFFNSTYTTGDKIERIITKIEKIINNSNLTPEVVCEGDSTTPVRLKDFKNLLARMSQLETTVAKLQQAQQQKRSVGVQVGEEELTGSIINKFRQGTITGYFNSVIEGKRKRAGEESQNGIKKQRVSLLNG
ncbi:MAG: hypothetical protein ABSA84_01215 [Gammaproteobacteria bacterium]